MHRASARVLPGLALWTLAALTAVAADWPNYRGPSYDGVSAEKNVRSDWSKPPKTLWQREIGSAFSAFAVVGGKAYTCGTKDKQQVLFCLDANKGDVVWEAVIEPEFPEKSGGDGARATPTVDDGRVYIQGALGRLVCYEAANGKPVWDRTLKHKPRWGYSGSVLIEGDLAIVPAGADEGAFLALDKKTGKEVWKCGDDPAGYATAYPITFDGKRYIVGFTGKSVIIADAKTGRLAWRTEWKTDWDVNAASPIFHDGYLYLGSGYKHGAMVYKLGAKGDELTAEKVWPDDAAKVLLTKFEPCVLHQGYLYVGDQNDLKCVEFMTGKEQWKQRGMANATVVLADGWLIVLSEDGKLMFAKPDPKEFKPVGETQILSGRCWTVPTLANGKLYLRDFEKAVCVDLK